MTVAASHTPKPAPSLAQRSGDVLALVAKRRALMALGRKALAMPADDCLNGIEAIAAFLTDTLGRTWTSRQVRYARERGSLPIRQKETLGVYAFKSELLAALKAPDSLPPK